MKKQYSLFLCTLSICFLIACKSPIEIEKEALEVCFSSIQNHALAENEAAIATLINEESTQYLTDMLHLIINDSSAVAKEKFSERQKFPLVTQLFLTAVDSNALKFYNEAIPDVNNMIYFISATNYGITSPKDCQRYSLKASQIIDDSTAVAIMRIQIDYGKFITSDINFNKENKEWKLDLIPTYSFLNKYLHQQKKRYKGNPEEFIPYLLSTGGTNDFYYRH